ncbi:MAG: ABC transporter permease [Tissierellaceae bacterium]|nr:ABC transporter permease [Tissierellaceae bacterium]
MKEFIIVLKFELMNYLKNKTFLVSTLIICLLLGVGLSIPTIKDTFFSDEISGENLMEQINYGYVDESNSINIEDLQNSFNGGLLIEVKDIDELKEKVNSNEFDSGFIIKSPTKYEYVVRNNEMMDYSRSAFEEALKRAYRINEFELRGIDYYGLESLIYPNIESETMILGKDSAKNYMYTYVLVFGLYFIIMLYGQLIATSVASEKSNRAMEVLVTSTKTTNLIFGKVLSGALAGFMQFGAIIFTATFVYKINTAAWNNSLDFIFNIPGDVLLSFAAFGILGYLFYSFIYGALGALVSRTEDVSSSATPVTIIFIAVFMISVMGMQNTEGIVLKIASFVPFSSFMAMFVRVSMGSVSTLEVFISLGILGLSTVLVGILAAKIYRMGTLMYGNPVKLKDAFKILRSK